MQGCSYQKGLQSKGSVSTDLHHLKYTIVTWHLKNCLKIKNENEECNEISNIDTLHRMAFFMHKMRLFLHLKSKGYYSGLLIATEKRRIWVRGEEKLNRSAKKIQA